MVHEGYWQATDRGRNRLCGQPTCWRRLSRTKGDPRIVDAVRTCHPCAKECAGEKRPDGVVVVTVAEALDPGPAEASKSSQPESWAKYRWCLLQPDEDIESLARNLHDVVKHGGLTNWQKMRRGFLQHGTGADEVPESVVNLFVSLRNSAEIIGRRLLHGLGVTNAFDLFCREMEMLAMEPCSRSAQCVHMDLVNHQEAIQCYVMLIYLTPEGTVSTAFTEQPPEDYVEAWVGPCERPPYKILQKLGRKNFATQRVGFATVSVFRCDVVHFGDKNPDAWWRHVAFFSFQPRALRLSCAVQRYPWGVTIH